MKNPHFTATATLILLVFSTLFTVAQDAGTLSADRKIEFPDIAGYQTLKCDFHMHTVLSDGSVWPNIRVQEAIRDGLDAISITDHIEYQPHIDDIPHPDRNRGHEIATDVARNSNTSNEKLIFIVLGLREYPYKL